MGNMKKILFYFGIFAVFALFFASCGNSDPSFDESLLVGKWRVGNTNQFYRYDANRMGMNWDEDDDVSEAEGTKFDWRLNKSELELRFYSRMTGEPLVWEIYTITTLTSTTFRYRDDFGRVTSLTKVN
jgi:hypothetical protein